MGPQRWREAQTPSSEAQCATPAPTCWWIQALVQELGARCAPVNENNLAERDTALAAMEQGQRRTNGQMRKPSHWEKFKCYQGLWPKRRNPRNPKRNGGWNELYLVCGYIKGCRICNLADRATVMGWRRFSLSKTLITILASVQFSSVQLLSHIQLFVTPWTTARQDSLSITNSQSLLKLMSIKLVMPSNHLILCRPLLLPPSIFPSIRVFSSESILRVRWTKVLELQLQHQSFQWIFRTDFL